MKNDLFYYSVGALLYCPANNSIIVHSLASEKFGKQFSLALCLEDTIRDELVSEAEQALKDSMDALLTVWKSNACYIPKLFIRVREPRQIGKLGLLLQDTLQLITGFITPKFSMENADAYIEEILSINQKSCKKIYIMPILESPSMIHLVHRYPLLYELKDKLDAISELVLNIRVGGNDLCQNFGCRRQISQTIYQISPVAALLSDILCVFAMDYVVSGPVWEYYHGSGWKSGLREELQSDLLNGFIGKTVIHPNQIALVNEALAVSKTDYNDACSILHWDHSIAGLVSGNTTSNRMNEYKTHSNWAKKILILSELYGIK